ncbi:rhamnogalacturonan acetylesterase [Streptomyces sp. NPDC012474]|uniref:rhamnogalacturonan acetylesterase n=1 Tax=Streptomyces sp. NPDC012474 TaxID=3364836 RepID=UPI0036E9B544
MSPTPAFPPTRLTRRMLLKATTATAGAIAGAASPGVRLGVAGLLTVAALAGTGAAPGAAAAAPQALPAGCSGTSPITCRYAVAPGNYDVTVSIGGSSAGQTEMWAEARRLMLPATRTAAGAVATYSFTVNVRQPEGQPTGQGGTGNPGLDLRFAGAAPQVSAVSVKPAAQPLVAYLAGDSTVCDQPAAPYTGWGQMITTAVRAGVSVANYGDSGESSGSFLSNSALLPALVSKIRANDPVFIQFGHNDKQTSASAYRNNLTTMISRVRAKGGVPVLVTPPVRRLFDGNRLTSTALHVNGVGVNLPAEMRAVGAAQRVPVIDLTARSKALVESMGPSASAQLFLRSSVDGVTDNTHFSQYGASQMGGLLLQSIREQNLPLAAHLR